jgi:iron(III) transport system substrate-binding protein
MTIWSSMSRNRRSRAFWAASSVLAAGVVVAACSSAGSSSQQDAAPGATQSGSSLAGQTITLYYGQHEQTTDSLV